MDWKAIGQTVRDRRESLGLTQREAAEAGRVSLPVWNALENGRQTGFKPRTLRGAARALGWPADAFDRLLADEPLTPTPTPDLAELQREFDTLRAAFDALVQRIDEWTDESRHPVPVPPRVPTADDPPVRSPQVPPSSTPEPHSA